MTEFKKSGSHELKKKMIKIKVIPTEIYSRVVGYYRPVQNWNKGKVEEFSRRKTINPQLL
jgi:anaerobic ribonucleoside-triphosphate reductase